MIAASGAQFGLTETRLGLIPATISPYVIARTGEARARPLFMSARVFGAEEAKVAGFVTTVVDGTMLDGAVEAAVTAYPSRLRALPGGRSGLRGRWAFPSPTPSSPQR